MTWFLGTVFCLVYLRSGIDPIHLAYHQNNLGCAILVVNVNVLFREVGIIGAAAFTWNLLTTNMCVTHVQGVNMNAQIAGNILVIKHCGFSRLWHALILYEISMLFWILENAPLGSRFYKIPNIQIFWRVRWTHVNYYPELFWGQNKFCSPVSVFFSRPHVLMTKRSLIFDNLSPLSLVIIFS